MIQQKADGRQYLRDGGVRSDVSGGDKMQDRRLCVKSGYDGIHIGSLRDQKSSNLLPMMETGEAKRLAKYVFARALTAKRRFTALLVLLPVGIGERTRTRLQGTIGL